MVHPDVQVRRCAEGRPDGQISTGLPATCSDEPTFTTGQQEFETSNWLAAATEVAVKERTYQQARCKYKQKGKISSGAVKSSFTTLAIVDVEARSAVTGGWAWLALAERRWASKKRRPSPKAYHPPEESHRKTTTSRAPKPLLDDLTGSALRDLRCSATPPTSNRHGLSWQRSPSILKPKYSDSPDNSLFAGYRYQPCTKTFIQAQ